MNRVRVSRGAGAGEPVHVWPSQTGAAPTEFVWRGRRYRIRAVKAATGEARPSDQTARRFHVRTTSGLSCVLSQDAPEGSWRMDRLVPSGGGR